MQLGRGAADVARRSLAVPDGLPRPFPSLGAAHNVLRVVFHPWLLYSSAGGVSE